MIIKNLYWISKTAKEAELTVSDGVNECIVFAQPCELNIGDTINDSLKSLDVESVMKVRNQSEQARFEKLNESYFSYHCIATVKNKEDGIVSIGGIILELEQRLPSWANEGDLIEFNCSRLDIW